MSSIERAMEKATRETDTSSRSQDQPTQSPTAESPAPEGEGLLELNIERLRTQGLLTPYGDDGGVAEAYRSIKRPLLRNAFGRDGEHLGNRNLIMVTSAVPGEGKTFTSFNLAMSMATELDHTVLLVDGDAAHGTLSDWLGLDKRLGLLDILANPNLDLSEAIVRTNVPKLRVVPSGRHHPQATELISSGEMRRVADDLAQRYPDRVVLFDSPPLLSASQAAALAGLVGQIALVVEAERTPQHLVKEALEQLDANKAVGLILNKTRQPFGSNYYGGDYGRYA